MAQRLTRRQRKEIAERAIRQARAAQQVEALALQELESMTLDELVDYFRALGIDVDLERLVAQVTQDMGQDLVDMRRGMDNAARADLEVRVVKSVQKTAQSVTRNVIRDATQAALDEADERPFDEQHYMWVAIGDGSCPSCLGRHRVIDTRDSWDGDAPGDGTTLCKDKCRCRLVPVQAQREQEGLVEGRRNVLTLEGF